MFRITLDEAEDAKLVSYLQEIASRTILEAFEFTFSTNGDKEEFYDNNYSGFFEGMGMYFDGTDDDFGREWFDRKLASIKKKLEDPKVAYTFDVFEENLFFNVCMWIGFCRESGLRNRVCTIHKKDEASIRHKLMDEFGCEEEMARYYARSVSRCWQMTLRENEDDNLFFWDYDYLSFFENGFREGIILLKSIVGEQAGYGYAYVVHMFEEIGARAPLSLIGTKEANRIANDIALEAFRKEQEKMLQGLFHDDRPKYELIDDEDLPFS